MQHTSLPMVQVNGIDLHYFAAGEGSPVILLHGNGEDHTLFGTQIRQLTEAGCRVYAPDSRGHGANAPQTEFHYAEMAEDIFQFIQALGLERPALYGHSDGGILALLLALNHPGALGLMAISGTNLSPQGLQPGFLAECEAENAKAVNPLITLMLNEPHIDPADLRRIDIPVLVTVGEHDLILPEETARIAASLPHAETVTVPGADHGSYIVGSPVMGEMLLDFLRRHGFSAVETREHTPLCSVFFVYR